MDVSADCAWSSPTSEIKVFGSSGPTAAVGVAVLGQQPFNVGLAVLGTNHANQWRHFCDENIMQEANDEEVVDYGFALSPSGEFFAGWYQHTGSVTLMVWRIHDGVERIMSTALPQEPFGLEFSRGGQELYVLMSNKMGVVKMSRTPVDD